MVCSPSASQGQTFYNDMITNHELQTLTTSSESFAALKTTEECTKEIKELQSRNSVLEKIVGIQGFKLARLTERFEKLCHRLEEEIEEDEPDHKKPRRHTKTFSEGNVNALLMNEDEESHTPSPFPPFEEEEAIVTSAASTPVPSHGDFEPRAETSRAQQKPRDNLIRSQSLTTRPIEAVSLSLSIRVFINSDPVVGTLQTLRASIYEDFAFLRWEIAGFTHLFWDEALRSADQSDVELMEDVTLDMSKGYLEMEEGVNTAAELTRGTTRVRWNDGAIDDNWRMWWYRNVVKGEDDKFSIGFRLDLKK